jgi:hypothetical protein
MGHAVADPDPQLDDPVTQPHDRVHASIKRLFDPSRGIELDSLIRRGKTPIGKRDLANAADDGQPSYDLFALMLVQIAGRPTRDRGPSASACHLRK